MRFMEEKTASKLPDRLINVSVVNKLLAVRRLQRRRIKRDGGANKRI